MRLGEYPPASPPVQDGVWQDHAPPANKAAEDVPASDADPEFIALSALGFSKPLLAALAERARQNGTGIERELLHSGQVEEAAYYGAMARFLRLPFIGAIDPSLVTDIPLLDTQLQRPSQIRITHRHGAPQVAVVPEASRLADLGTALAAMPALGRDLAITTPSAVRGAVWKAGARRRAQDTVSALFDRFPDFSARIVLAGHQGFYAGLALAAVVSALIVMPLATLLLLHIGLSCIYLASLFLRFAAFTRQNFAPAMLPALPVRDEPLPCYTVMVALYREAAVAEQLIASLKRLDWPAALLDTKLVCEADDHETIAALKALALGPCFEIVEVPPAIRAPSRRPSPMRWLRRAGNIWRSMTRKTDPIPSNFARLTDAFRRHPRKSPACRRR